MSESDNSPSLQSDDFVDTTSVNHAAQEEEQPFEDKDLSDYTIFQNYQYPITAESQIPPENLFEEAQYPSWCVENGAPFDVSEIEHIFNQLTEKFGFQLGNKDNMFDFFMNQLDSRSSRMSCPNALLSLHSDYIGGGRSNYKKWYFVSHFELDERLNKSKMWTTYDYYQKKIKKEKKLKTEEFEGDNIIRAEYSWKQKMAKLSQKDMVKHLGLYLLIWGEANNVRFMPECICFIFKCALDYLESVVDKKSIEEINKEEASKEEEANKEEGDERTTKEESNNESGSENKTDMTFLDDVITPLYKIVRNQQYKLRDGKWVKNSKDHDSIIGYDDINQFFWLPENLKKIKLTDKTRLYDLPRRERFLQLKHVKWSSAFYKTYKEKRTWAHLFTNFSRIWIIHFTSFWYYTSFNSPSLYTKNYDPLLDNQPAPQVQWSVISLGGTIACLISIFATIFEFRFVPNRPRGRRLIGKLLCLLMLFGINVAPSIYIFGFLPLDVHSIHGVWIGISQFIISILTYLYLAITPPSRYFKSILGESKNHIKMKVFTESFPKLDFRGQLFSYALWIIVFSFKFFESYVFLTLSLRDPIRELYVMDLSRCRGEVSFGSLLCKHQAKILLVLFYVTDLVLYFLDTYLWYIIFNCCFSIGLSFNLGITVFTPWKNIFVRLPERIYSKLVYVDKNSKVPMTSSVAQVWNSIVVSLYREHLISLEQVHKLVYQFIEREETSDEEDYEYDPDTFIKASLFFVFQDDSNFNLMDFFEPGKEAERRISFFAQSLAIPLSEPIPTTSLPSFTVFVPHYSEKILMSLRELIKEANGSKVSVLDYLKQLNQSDWDAFVQDTKIYRNMSSVVPDSSDPTSALSELENPIRIVSTSEDLPYYCVGFKDSGPEYTLRTRIWCSLRCQTLYRTVSGFMNYETAIKLLKKTEDPSSFRKADLYPEESESYYNKFVQRKFRLLVSLQKYQKFNAEEKENIRVLVETFPNIQLSYLEEEVDELTNEIQYYSTLLNVEETDKEGNFLKKYRVKLSGNPVLGDGKSDNQNLSLIFYRGEYIQVVDANQDNYIEECFKIKSVLSDFEEYNMDSSDYSYNPDVFKPQKDPVAIIGAREYIFSENIGVLGDVAAAKEQTFGTLFARTMAEIGGKLHYGHPDFLNGIFMTTRGGISKAQKGLHLNEDIYAGMMAICRGGRIKHCDYYQCGKGRDLGFNTVSNFTVKIGAGMGEQLLSREHYYLGTSLPIDRFLSFYYAHAGFHINNLFISLSASLFMMVLLNLGALNYETISCTYDPHRLITEIHEPLGCYNLQPILNWVSRFVLSVFVCFFISFLPLLLQELIEKGVLKALLRIIRHITSLSPLFEVFICQIYAKSLQDNIIFGGAKYVATGRGFATSRQSFPSLFSMYSSLSINKGAIFFLIVMFACTTMWQVSLLWFFISFLSMCLAPILFNPHQFSWSKFFLDYKELVRWFSRGNSRWHNNSWYGYQKLQRAKVLGYKRRVKSDEGRSLLLSVKRVSFFHRIFSLLFFPLLWCFFSLTAFLFINGQTGVREDYKPVNSLVRIVIISLVPIVLNGALLLLGFTISCVIGPILHFSKFSSIVASFVQGVSVLICVINFEVLLFLEGWNFARTLCGVVAMLSIQRLLRDTAYLILTKELKDDFSNHSWWSGKWWTSRLGRLILTQPIREFIVKVIEMNTFSYDFILSHCLLFSITPLLFIPFIDKLHTMMLFWSKYDRNQYHSAIPSQKLRRRRRWAATSYGVLYFSLLVVFLALIIVPIYVNQYIPEPPRNLPMIINQLIQPRFQHNNDTGSEAPPSVPRERPGVHSIVKVF